MFSNIYIVKPNSLDIFWNIVGKYWNGLVPKELLPFSIDDFVYMEKKLKFKFMCSKCWSALLEKKQHFCHMDTEDMYMQPMNSYMLFCKLPKFQDFYV